MFVNHIDIAENVLKNTPYKAGTLYYCYDTGNVYFDSVADGNRIKISSDMIIVSSETERLNILAPVPGKIYCVLKSGRIYISNEGSWIRLGKTNFEITDVVVKDDGSSTGTKQLVIENSEIHADNTAKFVPDLSVADLATNITATCAEGSVTVVLTSSYEIPGRIIID